MFSLATLDRAQKKFILLYFNKFYIMYTWILLGIVVYLFYKIGYKKTLYWKERNVPHLKAVPFIGSMPMNLIRRKALADVLIDVYNKFPTQKYFGLHSFTRPTLFIRDPDLIKNVKVKDFDHFMNHTTQFISEEFEPLFGKNLFSLQNQRWKNMRSTLSPAFTSSKMRAMYSLINDCAEQFVKFFLKEAEKENEIITVEMKDIFTRYSNDVVASTAFGITCDSLINKENEFYMIGKRVTEFLGPSMVFKAIGFQFVPKLMKWLDIHVFDKDSINFFSEIITSNIRSREKEGTVRPDMIHLLMEAKKGQLKHDTSEIDSEFSAVEESSIGKAKDTIALTDEDIIAQAFLFFFAGYDNISASLSFLSYELAVNPDVQNKLYNEIEEVAAEGKFNYESILKMKYLDMVVSEILRKWPPAVFSERQCEKPYNIERENEAPLTIEKNLSVWIPIYAIHHDPQYFPNPEKFDPERFSDENKGSIQPFTYMPFSSGPRNCIGSRFALLQIKVLIVHLLLKFELTVVEKTVIPPKFNKNKFNLSAEGGIWLGMKPRN